MTTDPMTPERLVEPEPVYVADRRRRDLSRLRLWFHQVAPVRQSGSVTIPVVAPHALDATVVRGPARANWPIVHTVAPDGTEVVHLNLYSPCYIDMRDLHGAIATLAPALAEAHLFVHSTGDGPDDWADEIHLRDGRATVDRWRIDPDDPQQLTRLCERLLRLRDYDTAFRRFVSYLYVTRMPYRTVRDAPELDPFAPGEYDGDERRDVDILGAAADIASWDTERRRSALATLRRAVDIDPANVLAAELIDALPARLRRQVMTN